MTSNKKVTCIFRPEKSWATHHLPDFVAYNVQNKESRKQKEHLLLTAAFYQNIYIWSQQSGGGGTRKVEYVGYSAR